MKNILTYLTLALALSTTSYGQTPADEVNLQEKIEELISNSALSQAVTGICVRTADGKTIVDINADKMLVPASNMKLISTGTALHRLGPDFQYETSIGYDGKIIDGVLKGDLYVIGGGDPTIGSKDSIAVALDRTFGQWEAIIRSAGIGKIEGRIVGDGRIFDGMAEEPSWEWNDIGTYYGAGATGLMFYENTQSFSVSAGHEVGAPVNIRPYYPETPWMEFRYDCSTGVSGSGDLLYMYTSDVAPVAEIRGTFGVDRAAKRVDCANKFPEYTCAYYFRNWLIKRGLECKGEVADFRLRRIEAPDSICIIGSAFSPSLARIAFETNHDSNNLYAETLFRTLGQETVKDVLKDLGVDISHGVKIQDGSGLSRQNYVSPDFFCRFLEAMMDSPSYDSFLRSLPTPGGNGTLEYNLKSLPAEMRSRIKAKSGSMNGVRCYSGYITPSADDGQTFIFSVMTNNCASPSWQVRLLLDNVLTALLQLL